MVQTQSEAKRYFVDKVLRQARSEGVTLSDAERRMKSLVAAVAAGLAIAASGGSAQAQISDDVVKIGVLTDMCIGAQIVGPWLAKDLIAAYLGATFSTAEEFRRRVAKLAVMTVMLDRVTTCNGD